MKRCGRQTTCEQQQHGNRISWFDMQLFSMFMITIKRKASNWQNCPFHTSGGHSAVNQDSERSSHGCIEAATWHYHFSVFLKKHRGEFQSTKNNIPENPKSLNFKDFENNKHSPCQYKAIQNIQWKRPPGINANAPFTQSKRKAAGFVSTGVGLWWEGKLQQESINGGKKVFWGRWKPVRSETHWQVIEGSATCTKRGHIFMKLAGLSSTLRTSSTSLGIFCKLFSMFSTILQQHYGPKRWVYQGDEISLLAHYPHHHCNL